ncbi:MAG: hypothetical protein AAGC55_04470 [Myxococcota bacterium]
MRLGLPRVLDNRPYRRLFAAQVVALFGTGLATILMASAVPSTEPA